MMKLSTASRWFDKTIASDAYSPTVTFRCQLEPFDYVKVEGSAVKRRVMSTAVNAVLPARRTINIGGQVYLVGDTSRDHWNGEPLRDRYVLQGADDLVHIRSIGQVLANSAGTYAYASVDFNKYSTDERDNSNYHPQYHLFFGRSEAVPGGCVLEFSGRWFLVKNSYVTMAGLVDALSNELESPLTASATFKGRTYNPVTDTYTDTPTTVRSMRVRWQDQFAYRSMDTQDYERGDAELFVPLSVTPKAGDRVTLADGGWKVVSVQTKVDHHSLHVRPA